MSLHISPHSGQARTADIVSLILNPSLLTGALFAVLASAFAPSGNRVAFGAVGVFFAGAIPIISVFGLRVVGRLSDVEMRVRSERSTVFAVCAVSYAMGTVVLVVAGAAWQIWGVMVLHLPTTAALVILTRRAKVSIHATGLASIWSAGLILFGWRALPYGLLLPLAAWARWAAGAHTPGELAAGTLLGLVSTAAGLLILRLLVTI